MRPNDVAELLSRGYTAEDLSDLGADEVVDFGIEGMDGVHAAALILAARAEEIARLERGA